MAIAATRWREAYDWIDRLSALDEVARHRELDSLSRENPGLYPRVITLIKAQRELEAANFMVGSALGSAGIDLASDGDTGSRAGDLSPGQTLGPYRLERPLGAGGMGEVWLARRNDGLFEAPVALKLLHAHLASSALRDRFVREGRILGQLSHPNVARLLDAGAMPDGRLYLALEYVEGDRIDRWCDQQQLDVSQRLHLFRSVCEAVSHAHARLVVHRDLKPSNILVTPGGEIKLLDFGIAKLIESEDGGSESTELTRLGGRALTPEYAAPEQVLGAAVTVATDVYSLGVLLFVLLTRRRPYGTETSSLSQIERAVIETDPPPPSRAVVDAAQRKPLVGDLDTITLKALKKSPIERYSSVSALADDVRRYLDHEPVLAQADSLAYRSTKFVERHRVGVLAAVTILLSLILGAVGIAWQAQQARVAERAEREQRMLAEQRAEELDEVVQFQSSMLRRVDVEKLGRDWLVRMREQIRATLAKERPVPVADEAELLAGFERVLPWSAPSEVARQTLGADVLAPADKEITERFSARPLLEADLRTGLARSYLDLGLYAEALAQVTRAVTQAEAARGPEHPQTLASRLLLARIQLAAGDAAAAGDTAQSVVDSQLRAQGADHPDTLSAQEILGRTLLARNDYPAARVLAETVLERRRRVLGPEHRDTLATAAVLFPALYELDDMEAALALAESTLSTSRRVLGPDDPDTLGAMGMMATASTIEPHLSRKRALLEELLAARRRVHGDSHPSTMKALSNLALHVSALGIEPEGSSLLRRAYEESRAALGESHPITQIAANNHARALNNNGQHEQALPIQQRLADIRRQLLGPDKRQTLIAEMNLGITLSSLGRHDEAQTLLAQTREAMGRVIGPDSELARFAGVQLGRNLIRAGKLDAASAELEALHQAQQRVTGPESDVNVLLLIALGDCYREMGQHERAHERLLEALAKAERVLGPGVRETIEAGESLARSQFALRRFHEARETATRMLETLRLMGRQDTQAAARMRDLLIQIETASGDATAAKQWQSERSVIQQRVAALVGS